VTDPRPNCEKSGRLTAQTWYSLIFGSEESAPLTFTRAMNSEEMLLPFLKSICTRPIRRRSSASAPDVKTFSTSWCRLVMRSQAWSLLLRISVVVSVISRSSWP